MVDRLEMAKQYVAELLEKRDDIVGVLVAGSVARGDADETSDIDLKIVVEGREGGRFRRGGIDTWRDGVYIEAGLVPSDHYDEAETVLLDPFGATEMFDARILYDPTGTFTRVQEEVRSAFSEPKWLGVRVRTQVQRCRGSQSRLREVVSAGDTLGVCEHAPWVAHWLSCIPLVRWGVTPRTTRTLTQLVTVAPEMRERICEWQGSTNLSPQEVAAYLPTPLECLAIIERGDLSQYGQVFREAVTKAKWYADKGLYQEALYMMWWVPGGMADVVRRSGDAGLISGAHDLAETWLRAAGWEGQEVLEEKVRMAEEMVAEVEAMAAHLPSDEPD